MASTPRRRSSASHAYAEPQSQLLLQALRDRRGSTTTPQPREVPLKARPSPAPRRPSMRGTNPFQDEWLATVEQPTPLRAQSTGPQRPQKRRASVGVADTDDAQRSNLSIKETNTLIDKLQKQIFDLKLRMSLLDDRNKKLNRELDESRERLDEADRLQQRYHALEGKAVSLEHELSEVQNECEELRAENDDLLGANQELNHAFKQAVEIIHAQDDKIETLVISSRPRARSFHERAEERRKSLYQPAEEQADSDYYSAEPDTPHTATSDATTRLRPSSSSGSSWPRGESDYYSNTAQSSPASAAPKTPGPVAKRTRPLAATRNSGQRVRISDVHHHQKSSEHLAHDVEPVAQEASSSTKNGSTVDHTILPMGSPTELRTPRPLRRTRRTDAAALASMRLQHAGQHVSRPPLTLHNRQSSSLALQPALETPKDTHSNSKARVPSMPFPPAADVLGRSASEPPQDDSTSQGPVHWRGARPLRQLHQSGELNRPVTAGADSRLNGPGEAPVNATPSTMLDDESGREDEDAMSITPTSLSYQSPLARRPVPLYPIDTRAPFRKSTGTAPDFLPRDSLDDDQAAMSEAPSIPETITSQTPKRSRDRKWHDADGSPSRDYFSRSTTANDAMGDNPKDGSPPWNVSREVLRRDMMLRH